MMKRYPSFYQMALVGFIALAAGGEMTTARAGFDPSITTFDPTFILGGVANGSAKDLSGLYGVITVNNLALTGGTGTFTGTATEAVTATSDTIVITGTVTGTGTLVVQNNYEAYSGLGYEFVSYSGILAGVVPDNASIDGAAHSSSFSNNNAFAATSNITMVPSNFANSDTKIGTFAGGGTITGTFDFAGMPGANGSEFVLPSSVGNAVGSPPTVPEPSSICLTSLAIGLLVVSRRVRSRFVPAS